ncbi:MAG: NUDIX hydrolase [Candidatus Gracilibacteria bacterium]|jgi:ADP-ribose pyrophosphatase YjhB (NUDIX family)
MAIETKENILWAHAEEIEDPLTEWKRVRELWVAMCESGAKPELIEVAIGIIQNPLGEKLLLKRPSFDRSYPNEWCFPGGRREFLRIAGNIVGKEPLDVTVRRETFEETALNTVVARKIAVRRAVQVKRGRLYVVHGYLLDVEGDPNAIQLSNEHTEYRYFPRESAPEGMGRVTRDMFSWEPSELIK